MTENESAVVREPKAHFYYLDWLRGFAAFMVFAYHTRNLLFLDAGENPRALGWMGKIFYFITGFGHLSVVVFFVLSGCVIAHAVIPALARGTWSWKSYFAARVTRLWVVLLPGLLLTLMWDSLAWKFFPDAPPHLSLSYAHMLTPSDRDALGGATLLGNAFFLQTILVRCYGSNGALWSLANEFWYYVIFPFVAACCWGARSPSSRIASGFLAVVVLWWTGAKIAGLFPVWLLGVGVYLLWRRGVEPRGWLARWGVWLAGLAAIATLSFFRIHAAQGSYPGDDLGAGFAVAVLGFFLLYRVPGVGGVVNKFMLGASKMSFTLYVAHTPVLVFIASAVMSRRSERWPFDGYHFGCFALIVAAVLSYAYLIYRISEAHTSKVRKWVERGLRLPA